MNKDSQQSINILAGHLFREHHGKMVSLLSSKFGYHQIDNVLDALQESFEAALKTWKFSGVPKHPVAWLCRVAGNNLLNRIKRSNLSHAYLSKLPAQEKITSPYDETEAEDSLLKLLIFFSTANFSERNKLIISLYFLCGFNYSEIANALLLKTETVKKTILRGKETIKEFSCSYEHSQVQSIENQGHLLQVIYLLFNEGYKSSQKNGTINNELCFEAMRLATLIHRRQPDDGKTNSLLAVMFFHCSRFPARTAADSWISLELQDRSLWDSELISAGFQHLRIAKKNLSFLDKYYIEAVISSLHCSSETYEKTDWKMITYLYRQLEQLEPYSISVTLNRILAESHFKDLTGLLSELNLMEEQVGGEMAFFYFAARAYCYTKLKSWKLAMENYQRSLVYAKNKTDFNFINRKIKLIMSNDQY